MQDDAIIQDIVYREWRFLTYFANNLLKRGRESEYLRVKEAADRIAFECKLEPEFRLAAVHSGLSTTAHHDTLLCVCTRRRRRTTPPMSSSMPCAACELKVALQQNHSLCTVLEAHRTASHERSKIQSPFIVAGDKQLTEVLGHIDRALLGLIEAFSTPAY
jgi:hypothetical protein